MTQYKVGDKVTYHPIGGDSDNTSTSTGEIVEINEDDGKYGIKNDNTGKVTHYMLKNIIGKA